MEQGVPGNEMGIEGTKINKAWSPPSDKESDT